MLTKINKILIKVKMQQIALNTRILEVFLFSVNEIICLHFMRICGCIVRKSV